MTPKKIKLHRNERIVAVVPESAKGPGWQDSVVWVHIVDTVTNKYRCESIQKHETTPEMHVLFDIGERVCCELLLSVPVVVGD